ncbi:MAG: Nif3-like dinuclear metal center hexameric protein [Flavobacteriales bacterium]|nr:Nif3-like dinuclear metal center hexameric protein [Flavobacteriales bacterium]
MLISEVIEILEKIAPPTLQESYDNAGLIVGSKSTIVTGVLVSLDATEDIVSEAMAQNCNLIVAHHPIVFKGLKQLNGKNYVERTVIKAIKNDIAIYAIHTNLDNVLHSGVNQKIAQKIGLTNVQILQKRKGDLLKLSVFVPQKEAEKVMNAMFDAGAGHIGNYDECSFKTEGIGSFRAGSGSNPSIGTVGERHYEKETKVEVVLPAYAAKNVVKAMQKAHSYEEVAYDLVALQNEWNAVGAGIVGELSEPIEVQHFLKHLKQNLRAEVIKFTSTDKNYIQKVAVCGGSGSFLIGAAMASGADAYVTGDVKYHEFFDGENKLMICDVGHYESEQFTIELLGEILLEKNSNFAVIFSKTVTNPIKYFY